MRILWSSNPFKLIYTLFFIMGMGTIIGFPELTQYEVQLEQIIKPSIYPNTKIHVDFKQAGLFIEKPRVGKLNKERAYISLKQRVGFRIWQDTSSNIPLKDLAFLAYMHPRDDHSRINWQNVNNSSAVRHGWMNERLYLMKVCTPIRIIPNSGTRGAIKVKLFADEYDVLRAYLRELIVEKYIPEPKLEEIY